MTIYNVDVSSCRVMSLHFFVKFQLNMSVPFASVPCDPQCKRNADTDSVKCVWKSPLQGKVCFFEFESVFSSISMFFDTVVRIVDHMHWKMKRSNCRIPCHSKLYPLKSGYLATQLVHALSLFYVFKRRNSRYTATWLRSALAKWLRGYAGTSIKERVRFMCSVLVSAQGLLFRHID